MTYSSSDELFENLTLSSFPSWPCFTRSWCVLSISADSAVFRFFLSNYPSGSILYWWKRTQLLLVRGIKELKSVYRKHSCCWPPKGSQFDWYAKSVSPFYTCSVYVVPTVPQAYYNVVHTRSQQRRTQVWPLWEHILDWPKYQYFGIPVSTGLSTWTMHGNWYKPKKLGNLATHAQF